MWKLQNYSVTDPILREIKVNEFKVSKCVILAHLESLKYDFYEFLSFLKTIIKQIEKDGSFRTSTLNCPKLISSKIWVTKKIHNFTHRVQHNQFHFFEIFLILFNFYVFHFFSVAGMCQTLFERLRTRWPGDRNSCWVQFVTMLYLITIIITWAIWVFGAKGDRFMFLCKKGWPEEAHQKTSIRASNLCQNGL